MVILWFVSCLVVGVVVATSVGQLQLTKTLCGSHYEEQI